MTTSSRKGQQRLVLLAGLAIAGLAINGLVWWNDQPLNFGALAPLPLDQPSMVKQAMSSVVEIKSNGLGTGFAIDSTTLLTNAHVIRNPKSIQVTTFQGRVIQAKLIGMDRSRDIAVLQIPAVAAVPPLKVGNTEVGAAVIAIGMPMGQGYTVTGGILSAKNRTFNAPGVAPDALFLQTDAAINPGNSGGPLLNERGEVVGINSLKLSKAEGIGYAIPIEDALAIANRIKSGRQKP